MSWQTVLSGVDAVESWMAGQSYWTQVPILLAVLLPLAWLAAGVIDRVVDKLLWPQTRRELRAAAVAALAVNAADDERPARPHTGSVEQPGARR